MKRILLVVLFVSLAFPLFAFSFFSQPSGTFLAMKTEDTQGASVDVSLFSDYDITMVNVFTTWCTYCIREMSDLMELKNQLPENVNLVGICADYKTARSAYEKLQDQFHFNFQILTLDQKGLDPIVSITGYPTTLFVDRTGCIVSSVSGAPRNPVADYTSLIEKALEKVKK